MQCLTGFEIVILDEHIKCSHRSNAHESFSCPIKKDPLHLFVAFFSRIHGSVEPQRDNAILFHFRSCSLSP